MSHLSEQTMNGGDPADYSIHENGEIPKALITDRIFGEQVY